MSVFCPHTPCLVLRDAWDINFRFPVLSMRTPEVRARLDKRDGAPVSEYNHIILYYNAYFTFDLVFLVGIFFMLVSNYIIRQPGGLPPPGSAVESAWPRGQGSAPLLNYVKDLTPSDTLVNCTYLESTLWDAFFTVTNIL
jgi:hypothetical protein